MRRCDRWSGTNSDPMALSSDVSILPYNAHPPVTILLMLPLGFLNFKSAWIVWNVLSVLCLLTSIVIILKATSQFSAVGLFTLVVFIATSHPFQETIYHGQLSCVLLLLVTAAWTGLVKRPGRAGALIGIASALKLFPCLLLIPMMGRRNWTGLIAATVCVTLLSAGAMAVVGYQGCRSYALDVAPSIGSDHAAAWGNQSLLGLYHKLFGNTRGKFRPLYRSDALEKAISAISVALACLLAPGGIVRTSRGGSESLR